MNGSLRRIATLFSALAVVSALSACSNTLGVAPSEGSFFGPRVLSGNDRSVSVEILPVQNESDALATAEKWCKKYSRSAVLVQDRGDGKFNYQCVQ